MVFWRQGLALLAGGASVLAYAPFELFPQDLLVGFGADGSQVDDRHAGIVLPGVRAEFRDQRVDGIHG